MSRARTVGTIHPQVGVRVGRRAAEVDVGIAALIREIWRAGWETIRSCEDHIDTKKVWVEFASPYDAERFLDVVAGPRDGPLGRWRRSSAWGFGWLGRVSEPIYFRGPESAAWEYHLSVTDANYDEARDTPLDDASCFMFSVSVLFPQQDLDGVVQQLDEHNARRKGRKTEKRGKRG